MTKFICKDCDTPCYYDDGGTTGKLGFTPSRCISVGEDELVPANWEKCENVNPPIEAQYGEIPEPNADADVDALLEVIKHKDAVIDNCRSSLEEYRQKSYEYMSEIAYLKKTSDPDLYLKLKNAEARCEGLGRDLKEADRKANKWRRNIAATLTEGFGALLCIIAFGAGLGFLVGLCL